MIISTDHPAPPSLHCCHFSLSPFFLSFSHTHPIPLPFPSRFTPDTCGYGYGHTTGFLSFFHLARTKNDEPSQSSWVRPWDSARGATPRRLLTVMYFLFVYSSFNLFFSVPCSFSFFHPFFLVLFLHFPIPPSCEATCPMIPVLLCNISSFV